MATDPNVIEYGKKEYDRLANERRSLPLDNAVRLEQYATDSRNQTANSLKNRSKMESVSAPVMGGAGGSGSQPSLLGFAGDVADRTINNYREKGLIGGGAANMRGVWGAAGQGVGNIYEGAKDLTSEYVMPALFGKNPPAMQMPDINVSANDNTPTKSQTEILNGEFISGQRPEQPETQGSVGLNGSIRPNVPANPFKMETGIDASRLPGGAFGGLNALNIATAALLPYKAEQDKKRAAAARQLANRPKIDTITTQDGREIPMVLDPVTGQRLDPNNINPETGLPMPMMSRSQMMALAQPRIDMILGDDNLNDAAKRQRLDLINGVFSDSGYEPINVDELL